MMKDLPKAYEPEKYEDGIYEKWLKSGYFNPDNLDVAKDAKSYSIVMPPPNVTGTLHIGHAVMLAVQDILIRYHRMKGERTLWVPGTDHAAIATQTKVDKLLKEKGVDRHQLGREKFLEEVKDFAHKSHDTIVNQTKKMGSSCDWSREAYTLDETRNKAVRAVFKMMYDDGLIYRGERIVNWCPKCESTLADDEIEYKAQKAKLYTFRYSKNFPIAISTTRPETKLGDTAVAVNPNDNRYKEFIGRVFEVDFVGTKLNLKIIADRNVDMNFGTGALGVTPAHSMVDWQMSEENNLSVIKVIDEQGNIKPGFNEYSGLTAKVAREKIILKLQEMELIEKEEEIENNLSLCYRCDTPIEPLPSLQWFIDVNKTIPKYGKSIKELSSEAVRKGVFGKDKIKIIPERFEKNYFYWMDNLRDWCISRQIWFGHQIPVWYKAHNTQHVTHNNNDKEIYVGIEAPEEKTNFVFLHGFYRTQEVKDPLAWLNKLLKNKNNFFDILPHPDKPNLKEQSDFVLNNAKITEETVIVTHSLGGILALKLIENNNLKIKKLVMIASPIRPRSEETKDYNKGNEFDFDKIKKNVGEIVIFRAGKDHAVAPEDISELAEALDARIIEVTDTASHFNCEECAEILDELKKGLWTQDGDTLDTWFSSGLWTFSTLAHNPEEISLENGNLVINNVNPSTPSSFAKATADKFAKGGNNDFKNFHPTNVLETGYDILFFWIARMIIMTTYAIGDIPFQDVYLHGLVLDEKGKKMSKSKGNVIDPLDMIKKFGTDAVRLSLVIGSTPGNDMRLSEEKIGGYKNFVNKLWNIARYVITNYELRIMNHEFNEDILSISDKWILGKTKSLISNVSDDLDNYRFSQAGERLRIFTWDDLADWYLEASKFEKSEIKTDILSYVLSNLLKLWHPFIPFCTEVIWKEIFDDKMLIIEEWPTCAKASAGKPVIGVGAGLAPAQVEGGTSREDQGTRKGRPYDDGLGFELIKNIIIAIRNARSENKVEPAKKVKAVVYAGKYKEMIESQSVLIKSLRTGINELEITAKGEKIEGAIYAAVDGIEIYLLGAIDAEKENARIKKEIANLENLISGMKGKLDNKEFIDRAPEAIVNKEKEKLEKYETDLEKLREQAK